MTSPTSSMSEMPYFLYAINNDPHFRVALGVHEVGPTNPEGTRYQEYCTRTLRGLYQVYMYRAYHTYAGLCNCPYDGEWRYDTRILHESSILIDTSRLWWQYDTTTVKPGDLYTRNVHGRTRKTLFCTIFDF